MKRILIIASIVAASVQLSAQGVEINPMTRLQGSESGLYVSPLMNNINLSPDISLRGVSSVRSGGGPLWIVDGVILNNSHLSDLNPLSYLNPYDIQSVKVVKNISQSSVYGGKGAEGSIIINTASPEREGFNVNYHGNAGVTMPVSGVDNSRTGCVTNHALSFTGHQGKTFYGVSGFYTMNQGAMKGNDSSLGGVRTVFTTRTNRFLWFTANTTFSLGKMEAAVPGEFLEDWSEDFNDEAVERRVTNSSRITLNILDNLKMNVNLGVDFHNTARYIWYGLGIQEGKEVNGQSFITGTGQFRYSTGADISWFRYFNGKHKLSAEGAFELEGGNTDYTNTGGSDFFSHYLRARGIGLAASDPFINTYKYNYLTLGGYAMLAYDFDSVIGTDVLVRIDNTPRYDDSRVRLYKSANVYADLHKWLMPQEQTVSSLRIDAGYGDAGKESPVPYSMYPLYISGDYKEIDPAYQMFYEGLGRMRSSEFNVSLEAGFLSDRIIVGAGYYDRMTNDSFFAYCFGEEGDNSWWNYVDRMDDYSATSIVANRGFEADLSVKILDKKNISWSLNANASYNVNQMLKVSSLDGAGTPSEDEMVTAINVLGAHAGAYYGYRTDADGHNIDQTGDGVINEYDKQLLGNPVPEYFGGFGTSLRFSDFSLDISCSYAGGFDKLDLSSLYANEKAPYALSDKYVVAGDYFSLSKIAASYRFNFKKKGFIKGIAARISGMNLFISNNMYLAPRSVVAGVSIHI